MLYKNSFKTLRTKGIKTLRQLGEYTLYTPKLSKYQSVSKTLVSCGFFVMLFQKYPYMKTHHIRIFINTWSQLNTLSSLFVSLRIFFFIMLLFLFHIYVSRKTQIKKKKKSLVLFSQSLNNFELQNTTHQNSR